MWDRYGKVVEERANVQRINSIARFTKKEKLYYHIFYLLKLICKICKYKVVFLELKQKKNLWTC